MSVVIPVLDGEAFLAQAIRSALNQSLPPHEILVADNGSRDGSVAIAGSFGAPVRVMGVPRPGAAAARAAAAAQTEGDALMFLDADDLVAPDTLAHLAAALDGHRAAMACCPWRRYERVGACWRARPASCAPRRPGQDDLAAWLTGWYHPPCSMLWTRDAYEAAGGWDPEARMNQDGDLVMRALVAGVPLLRARGGLGYYRRLPDGGVSLSGKGRTARGLEGRLDVLEKIEARLGETGGLRRYGPPLSEAFGEIAAAAAGAGAGAGRALERARAGMARNGGARRFADLRRGIGRRLGVSLRRDPVPGEPPPARPRAA
ncbi:MAG: glycosyltransferase family 2 protein, partial [Roseicyclus sp.]